MDHLKRREFITLLGGAAAAWSLAARAQQSPKIPRVGWIATGTPQGSEFLEAVRRIPVISGWSEFAKSGGTITYGPNLKAVFQRLAIYVDKILKGANPGELAVEQPTKFELVVNAKTAKALGFTIPPLLLARADEVIE